MEFKDLSAKEQKLVVSYKYDSLRDKSIKLKEKGIDNCMDDSDFNLKGMKITQDARELIDLAVPQIINYKGLVFKRPLEGLGIGGFYYFLSLFYFKRKRQLMTRFEGHTMDSMLMKHSITSDEMWLVNKVDEIPDEVIEQYKVK
jgi:hypothetical protein